MRGADPRARRRMMGRTLRIGIVGAGGVVRAFHVPVLAEMAGVRVEWLCDANVQRAKELARLFRISCVFDDVRQCPDVDSVLVAIPVGHRAPVYDEILARRWHLFAEKPLARNAADHASLVARGAAAGVEVCVGLVRRVFAATPLVQRLLAQEVFGPVLDVRASEGARLYASQRGSEWYQADPRAAGGGVLIERGSHLIDHTLFILQVRQFADIRAVLKVIDGIDVDVRVAATLKTERGRQLPVAFGLSLTHDLPSGIVIRCRHANIRVGVTDDAPVTIEDDQARVLARLDGDDRGSRTFYQGFYLEWEAFLGQIRSRQASIVDAASALLSAQFIDAASAASADMAVTP